MSSFEDRLAQFVELEHLSNRVIAEQLGVAQHTVTRWRKAVGRPHGEPAVPRPAEDRERARRLIDDGCSIAEAARTVGVKRATVARWFPDAPRLTRVQCGEMAQLHRFELRVMGS